MRRRWRIQWPELLEDVSTFGRLTVLCLIWAAVGLALFVVAGIISTLVTGNDYMNGVLYIVLAAGMGAPLAIVSIGGLVCGIAWTIRHRPVRRVTESSPDIRDVYRR